MTTTATTTPVAQGLQTGHIGLNVSEVGRSSQFYQQVFGFELLGESQTEGPRFAFLGTEGQVVLTLWQQSKGQFETDKPGLHHLSFQASSIQQVEEAQARLKALQVPFLYEGIVPHAEGASSGGIFFADPDGIRLEIYNPTGANQQPAPVAGAPSCGFF